MASKLTSAAEAARMGTTVVIANGRQIGILPRILAGANVGTLIPASPAKPNGGLSHRRRWVAFFHHAQGRLTIDDGAREALLKRGRSLLPVGIREVSGDFSPATSSISWILPVNPWPKAFPNIPALRSDC